MNNEILYGRINRFFYNDICFPADGKNLSVEEIWRQYLSGTSITVNDALNILADLPRSVWEKDKDSIKILAENMLINAEFTWSKFIDGNILKFAGFGGRALVYDELGLCPYHENDSYWGEDCHSRENRLW